jgi:prephenate dehydrogenase
VAEPEHSDSAWVREAEIAVVGLGLMGGSLAAALRGGNDHLRRCRRVVGIARRATALPLAAPLTDEATLDLQTVAQADAVVVAVPPPASLRLLPQVAALMRPGALLTDLGSTKSAIVEVMSTLRDDILVAGGHPMCGKEAGGLAAADPNLYENAPFVLCPVPGRSAVAVARAAGLARVLDARPRILDAARHDRLVAAISHVPYTTAVALVEAAESLAASDGDTLWELAAGGFRDTTRVAAGELDMWIDILLTNQPAVLDQLDRLNAVLQHLRQALAAGDVAHLRTVLAAAQTRRRSLFR